ncbi:MAG: DUF427 domain-containing protein [Phycisphaerae bacterium]
MRAMYQGVAIAESDQTVQVDGNHYFPPDSIDRSFLVESETTSVCPWKGTASYYHVKVNDAVSSDAAWYYPDTKEEAKHFEGYVAFWKDVAVES